MIVKQLNKNFVCNLMRTSNIKQLLLNSNFSKHIIPLFIVNLWLVYYYIKRENSIILTHDNLDYYHILLTVFSKWEFIFCSCEPDIFMTGMSRVAFPPELHFLTLLYLIFTPLSAYILNQIIVHHIAYFGMYLLVSRHILQNEQNAKLIAILTALVFAYMPFWPFGGLTIAGQPLLVYSFFRFAKKVHNKFDWMVVILTPLYSSFLIGTIFFSIIVALLMLLFIKSHKEIVLSLIRPFMLMNLMSLIVEFRLVLSIIGFNSFVSQRTEFFHVGITFFGSIKIMVILFFFGQYHSSITYPRFVLFIIFFSLLGVFYLKNLQVFQVKIVYISLISLGFIAFWDGLFNSELFAPIRNQIEILRIFQWDRFYFLQPILWGILYAISLLVISKGLNQKIKNLKITRSILIVITIYVLILYSTNVRFGTEVPINHLINENPSDITYNNFFSPLLFEEIKTAINQSIDLYRVISLGIDPAIALYNGFKTLDGYLTNYDIEYKREFRKIIENELDKNEEIKNYFDNWGSRCYLFSSELGNRFDYSKNDNKTIYDLDINTTQVINMGGKYLISAVNVDNYISLGMTHILTVENSESLWRIYVFQFN